MIIENITMITNLDVPLLKKSVNSTFVKIEHKVDNISKELVIKEIENFPDKRDSRFSQFVSERYNEHKNIVKEYLKGNLKELGSAENNEYKVIILDNFKMLYIRRDDINYPVPVGSWMDWWEHDHEKYFEVSKSFYRILPLNRKAELEAKLQLKLWINREYYTSYAEFYLPQEYDKWWWDEGGADKQIKDFNYSNEYWKQRLQKDISYWWKPLNGRIESLYKGVRIVFHGTEDSPEFQDTYSDEQFQDAIDVIPEKHRKLIDYVLLSPQVDGEREEGYEFGRVQSGSRVIQIFKGVNLHQYGTSFEEQFAHEVGHVVARHIFGDEETNSEWKEISVTEHPVSKRAKIDAAEDFAESYSAYVNNEMKEEDYPKRYKKLKRLMLSQLSGKDIFDITTTGMSTYDVMLGKENIVGKYKNDPIGYFRDNKGLVFKIEWMSPEDYLKKVYEIHEIMYNFGVNKKSFEDYIRSVINMDLVEVYKEKTLEGSKMPMVVLDYSNMSQEGRHRSVVAMELEVEEIPVLVVRDL